MSDEAKRAKKVSKSVEGLVLTIKAGEIEKVYSAEGFSDDVKRNLMMHGLSQKLGDCFAGKETDEGVALADKTYEALQKGEWTMRMPAAEKITKKQVVEAFANLSEEELAIARSLGLLEKFNIKL